jgi:hypothetical protein
MARPEGIVRKRSHVRLEVCIMSQAFPDTTHSRGTYAQLMGH